MRLELITSCVSGKCSQPIELCHYKKCTENRIRTDKCLLTRQVLCQLSHPGINCIARMKRFELLSTVLETAILPLNYTRVYFLCIYRDSNPEPNAIRTLLNSLSISFLISVALSLSMFQPNSDNLLSLSKSFLRTLSLL